MAANALLGMIITIASKAWLLDTGCHSIVDKVVQAFAERLQDGYGHPFRAGDVHDISEPVRILNELIGLDDVLGPAGLCVSRHA